MMQTDDAAAAPTAIELAIATRMSVRAFTAQPVARTVLEDILEAAAVATAGPGGPACKVHVVQGHSRTALCDRVCGIHDALRADPGLQSGYPEPYAYYPETWESPYLERRRENGWGLYGLLGIGRTEKDKMHAQHQRNYRFFDAPVALVFTMDRARGGEHLLDCGRFMQSVMLQARLRDLHTCPQAAWNMFASVVLAHVGASADEALVCCMALGHADPQAIVNRYHTPRLPVSAFCRQVA